MLFEILFHLPERGIAPVHRYPQGVFDDEYPGGVYIRRGKSLLWEVAKNVKEHGQVVRIRATLVADEEIIR